MKKKILYIALGILAIMLLAGVYFYQKGRESIEEKNHDISVQLEQQLDCLAGCSKEEDCNGILPFFYLDTETMDQLLVKLQVTREDFDKRVGACVSSTYQKQVEIIQQGSENYWEGYERPEGWKPAVNTEFRFMIDIPSDWKHYECSIWDHRGITVYHPDNDTRIHFAINIEEYPKAYRDENDVIHEVGPIDSSLIDEVFPEMFTEQNADLIAEYGNAFKYFYGAHANEIKDDALLVHRPEGVTTPDIVGEANFIRVNFPYDKDEDGYVSPTSPEGQEVIATMKTIITSFRRY